MESQELKEFSFCIISRKTNDKIKKKNTNTLFLDPFYPNLCESEFSTKIRLRNFLASFVP